MQPSRRLHVTLPAGCAEFPLGVLWELAHRERYVLSLVRGHLGQNTLCSRLARRIRAGSPRGRGNVDTVYGSACPGAMLIGKHFQEHVTSSNTVTRSLLVASPRAGIGYPWPNCARVAYGVQAKVPLVLFLCSLFFDASFRAATSWPFTITRYTPPAINDAAQGRLFSLKLASSPAGRVG